MINLTLTEEEHLTLAGILEGYLANLRTEIAHTDAKLFRDRLRSKEQTIQQTLDKLTMAADEANVAAVAAR